MTQPQVDLLSIILIPPFLVALVILGGRFLDHLRDAQIAASDDEEAS